MPDMITRCPSCDTSFRITDAQLQTAKGAVRCGACLHIFKAVDHLVSESGAPLPKVAKAEQPAPQKTYKESPKFEYHKPATPPSPVISLIDEKPAVKQGVTSSAPPAATKPSATENTGTQKPSVALKKPANPNAEIDFGDGESYLTNKPKAADSAATKTRETPSATIDGSENFLDFDQSAIDKDEIELATPEEDDILISDDLPFEDDDEPANTRKSGAYGDDLVESFLDLDAWKPKETSLFDREAKPSKKRDDDDKASPDESWALDLLNRDEDTDDEPTVKFIKPANRKTTSHSKDEERFLASDDGNDDDSEYSRSATGSFDAVENQDLEDDFDDSFGKSSTEPKKSAKSKSSSSNDYTGFDHEDHSNPVDDDDFESDGFENDDYEENFSDSFRDDDYSSDFGESYSHKPDRKSILKGITPAPVEFHYKGKNTNWVKPLLGFCTIVTGIALLVAQIAWFKFDSLSLTQPYRDMYAIVCPMVGCELPLVAAPELIKTTNFLVREHPSADDALMVDTILLNTASFEQPFPDLVITFSDINDKPVARRRFTPKEYLGGELAGKANIPSNKPVHLALEIVNPGTNAVSYTAHIPQ